MLSLESRLPAPVGDGLGWLILVFKSVQASVFFRAKECRFSIEDDRHVHWRVSMTRPSAEEKEEMVARVVIQVFFIMHHCRCDLRYVSV